MKGVDETENYHENTPRGTGLGAGGRAGLGALIDVETPRL